MKEFLIKTTLQGLIFTAKEKVCVLGDEANDDVNQLREIYEELVRFWEFDERYIDEFDMEVGSMGAE
ncbi:hypothetical protein [Haloimpatiens massiliensis]|uniref:hypothetical protein n=1 Tax=Haloimpatiens massiliensis TaxID=1658110 RepID=UPI000C863FA1|nr:hypothetical protein [Haloimpatiens massiliensis]